MKIYSIIIFGLAGTRPNVLSQARDINEFGIFKQSTVKEFLLFASREVIARTQPKETQSITQNSKDIEKKFIIHVHVNETKIGGVVITDTDYLPRAAHGILLKGIEETVKAYGNNVSEKYTSDSNLSVPSLQNLINQYQKPSEVDKISLINKGYLFSYSIKILDIDETKDIISKSIDQLLSNEENLQVLAQKSEDLSIQSKLFLKQTKEMNRCCEIL